MKITHLSLILLLSVVLLVSCTDDTDPSFSEVPVQLGDLDATRMFNLGNSLTAGFQSGGWDWDGLQNSYATLLARQIYGPEAIGIDELEHQYLLARLSDNGNPRPMRITGTQPAGQLADGTPVVIYSVSPAVPDPTQLLARNNTSLRSFNNLAVPGFMAFDILQATNANTVGGQNLLTNLILRSKGSAHQQARASDATFVTIWAGNNEVLGAALSGAVNPVYPPTESVAGLPPFTEVINSLVDPLVASGAKVVLATVPDVTVIPAVSGIGVSNPANNTRGFILDLNANGVWSDTLSFWGRDAADNVRTLTADERVLLGWLSAVDFGAAQPLGLHPDNPLPRNLWLSEAEITMLRTVLGVYNQILAAKAASSPNIALVDIHGFFNGIAADGGIPSLGLTLELFSGGIFSLDGVHPSDIAHRFVANEFIKVINEAFGAGIAEVPISAPTSMQSMRGVVDVTSVRESGLLTAFENAFSLYVN